MKKAFAVVVAIILAVGAMYLSDEYLKDNDPVQAATTANKVRNHTMRASFDAPVDSQSSYRQANLVATTADKKVPFYVTVQYDADNISRPVSRNLGTANLLYNNESSRSILRDELILAIIDGEYVQGFAPDDGLRVAGISVQWERDHQQYTLIDADGDSSWDYAVQGHWEFFTDIAGVPDRYATANLSDSSEELTFRDVERRFK